MNDESIASEVLAASIGGAISASLLYPLEVLKTKLQARQSEEDDEEDAPPLSMWEYAVSLYHKEGLKVYLRGMEWSAFQSSLEKGLYFLAYTTFKSLLYSAPSSSNSKQPSLTTLPNLIIGYASEWAHLPFTLPIDAWTTQIQTSSSNNNNMQPLALLLHMLQTPKDLYKGIQAYWLLCLKPALQYTVYEQVKQIWIARHGRRRRHQSFSGDNTSTSLTAGEAFVLGMVARTVATLAVFPLLRAKVLLQASPSSSSSSSKPQRGVVQLLQHVHHKQGVQGLYQGIGPELTRGVLSAALMLTIKERIATQVQQLLRERGRRQHTQQQQQGSK